MLPNGIVQSALFGFLTKYVCGSGSGVRKKATFTLVYILVILVAVWEFHERLPRTPYDVLKTPVHASPRMIQSDFRRQSLVVHPDRNPSVYANAAFKELMEAYQILILSEKRWRYDCYGDISPEGEIPFYSLNVISWLLHSRFLEFYCFTLIAISLLNHKYIESACKQASLGILSCLFFIDILLRHQPEGLTHPLFYFNHLFQLTHFQYSLLLHWSLPLIFSVIISSGLECVLSHTKLKQQYLQLNFTNSNRNFLTYESVYDILSEVYMTTQDIVQELSDHSKTRRNCNAVEQSPEHFEERLNHETCDDGSLMKQFDQVLLMAGVLFKDTAYSLQENYESASQHICLESSKDILEELSDFHIKRQKKRAKLRRLGIGKAELITGFILLVHYLF